jgi:hypothetical protein
MLGSLARRSPKPEPAPRLMRIKADAIDAGVQALILAPQALTMLRRMRNGEAKPAGSELRGAVVRVAGEVAKVLGERYRSPGQRIVGLRTVDRRTGEPVPLPVSSGLLALSIASGLLSKRVMGFGASGHSAPTRGGEALERELRAAEARGEDARDATQTAATELLRSHKCDPAQPLKRLARGLLLGVLLAQLQRRLRRRLAPMIVVIAGRQPGWIKARRSGRSRRA